MPWLVCHYALDHFGIALFIDQELSDSSVPCPDIGQEFLEAFNAPIREACCAVVGPVVDVHHFAVVDVIRVGRDLSEQFEVLADHGGDVFDRVDMHRTSHQAAFCAVETVGSIFHGNRSSSYRAIFNLGQDVREVGLGIVAMQFVRFNDGQDISDTLSRS